MGRPTGQGLVFLVINLWVMGSCSTCARPGASSQVQCHPKWDSTCSFCFSRCKCEDWEAQQGVGTASGPAHLLHSGESCDHSKDFSGSTSSAHCELPFRRHQPLLGT